MKLSKAQIAYVTAKAAHDLARAEYRAQGQRMDAECAKLGIETPYGILPEGHPMTVEAQRLLDADNAATAAMYAAARDLFDWASEKALARVGTANQKADVRAMVAKVKKMAFVQKPFIELVEISMKLNAA